MADGNEKGPSSAEESIDGTEKQESPAPKVEEPPKREAKPITISDLELEHLRREVHENKDKYLRLLAESENARKRLHKERLDLTQYAVQNVLVDFLNPIDHMENALKYTQNMSEDVKNWATGFQMILGQFKDVLANNGVQGFDSVGTSFDPHLHEAVETVETENHPPGRVVEESVKGYKMGERTIRPARVKVSKALSKPQVEEEKEEQKN